MEPLEIKGSRADIKKRNSQPLSLSISRGSAGSPMRRRVSLQYQESVVPLDETGSNDRVDEAHLATGISA